MEKTVGIAELTSITYGIAASDAMLKAGQVRMLRSAPMCPGKYLIVIGGDTGEVKAAMEAGAELAGKHLRNSYVIPHIHEQVLDALSKKSKVEPREAVGILESSMMVSAIYAADMAVKQAAVRLCRVRLGQGIGGKGVVIVAGDVGAVNAAVKAANPNWQPGQPFDSSILDSVTRELVESNLVQSGNQFVRKSIDYSV